jgi:hypothetical protein
MDWKMISRWGRERVDHRWTLFGAIEIRDRSVWSFGPCWGTWDTDGLFVYGSVGENEALEEFPRSR